jgi:hypothetical protein
MKEKIELLIDYNEQFNQKIYSYWKGRPQDSKTTILEPVASDIDMKGIYDKINELRNEIFGEEIEALILKAFSMGNGLPHVESDLSDAKFKPTFNQAFIDEMKVALKNVEIKKESNITEENTLSVKDVIDIQNSLFLFERNGTISKEESIFRFKDIPFEKNSTSFTTRREMKLSFERKPKSLMLEFEDLQMLKDYIDNNYNELYLSFREELDRVKIENKGDEYILYFEKGDGGKMSIYYNTGASRIYFI